MLQIPLKRKIQTGSIAAVTAVVLAGCGTVDIEYSRNLPMPDNYSMETSVKTQVQDLTGWWKHFNDPLLSELINAAIKNNPDLETARLHLQKAVHEAEYAGADLGPSAAAGVMMAGAKSNADLPVTLPGISTSRSNLAAGGSVTASWELDLFGRKQSNLDAAKYKLLSAEDQMYAARAAVAAQTALSYYDVLAAEEQTAVLNSSISNLEDTLRYVKGRFNSGEATAGDVQNTENMITDLKSRLSLLRAKSEAGIRGLAVLTGNTPQTFRLQELPKNMPDELPPAPTGGQPGELMLRRPDIRAKDNEISARAALVASAKADLYPRFEIVFLGGLGRIEMNGRTDHISGWGSVLSGSLTVPVFTNGRIRANIGIKNAELEIALAEYQSLILNALKEVDDSYGNLHHLQEQKKFLEKGLQESRRLEKTSARLFEFGKNNFDSITSARNRSLEFENRLVENRLGRIKSLISLYKSLGGGWNFEQAETAAEKTSAKQPGKYFAGNGSDNSR